MAIAAYFHPKNMTLAQFNEIHWRLEKAGAEPDPHRLDHSCFGDDGDLMVYDIWDSPGKLPGLRRGAHAHPRRGRC